MVFMRWVVRTLARIGDILRFLVVLFSPSEQIWKQRLDS
jgi:hypothetical protein